MNQPPADLQTQTRDDLPSGIRRSDPQHRQWIDALAGWHSVFGFGQSDLIAAATQGVADHFAAGTSMEPVAEAGGGLSRSLLDQLQNLSTPNSQPMVTSAVCLAHRDLAVEHAIAIVRRRHQGSRYRMITMAGSDHGQTGVCRTASGLPWRHQDYGPMMAGFAHVPGGDLDAVASTLDDRTGAILIAPLDAAAGAKPLDAAFLTGLRQLCDQHDLLLVVDESEIVFGSCGSLLATTWIADIRVDLAVLSAGLFAGLPGGLLVSTLREEAAGGAGGDAADDLESPTTAEGVIQRPSITNCSITNRSITDHWGTAVGQSVAAATLGRLIQHDSFASAAEASHQIAVEIAKAVAEFSCVRDVHPLGTNIGIELDHDSGPILETAARFGLRLGAAGQHGVRIALPLTIDPRDLSDLVDRIGETFRAVEKQSAPAEV